MTAPPEGALAEFAALRQEVDSRSATQQNLFVLQLTSAGALFGYALSESSRTLLLLIVPISTYLLCTRSLVQITSIAVIGEYIRDELEPKVEGLNWERYWRQVHHPFPFARWAHPNLLLFAGVSGLALAWTAPAIAARKLGWDTVGLSAAWLFGAVVTVYVAHLTWISATKLFGPRHQSSRNPGSAHGTRWVRVRRATPQREEVVMNRAARPDSVTEKRL